MSGLVTPIGTKGKPFVRDKRPLSPSLAWLAFGPGTKATYCPGPKGNRDKWPGTKACSVVVKQASWPLYNSLNTDAPPSLAPQRSFGVCISSKSFDHKNSLNFCIKYSKNTFNKEIETLHANEID